MNIEKILAEAPEGATHFSECLNGKGLVQHYLRYVTDDCDVSWCFWWGSSSDWWSCDSEHIEEFNPIHSLYDLREIQRLRAENEALKRDNSHAGLRAMIQRLEAENEALRKTVLEQQAIGVEDAIERAYDSCGVMLRSSSSIKLNWLENYAKQLRQATKGE